METAQTWLESIGRGIGEALTAEGKNPLMIDSKDPSISVQEYAYNETRYRMLVQSDEPRAEKLMGLAQEDATKRWNLYRQMAAIQYKPNDDEKTE